MEYTLPKNSAEAEYTDRKSVFLAHLRPVESEEEAQAFVAEMKKKYADARHNVWAYTLPNGSFRSSDDGEPSGTAGAPVLECMTKKGISGCVIVVTRYFGGILLGTGGLVHAYTEAASEALAAAGRVKMRFYARCEVVCSYTQYGKVSNLAGKFSAKKMNALFGENVRFSFLLSPDRTAAFESQLSEMSAGSLTLLLSGEEGLKEDEEEEKM